MPLPNRSSTTHSTPLSQPSRPTPRQPASRSSAIRSPATPFPQSSARRSSVAARPRMAHASHRPRRDRRNIRSPLEADRENVRRAAARRVLRSPFRGSPRSRMYVAMRPRSAKLQAARDPGTGRSRARTQESRSAHPARRAWRDGTRNRGRWRAAAWSACDAVRTDVAAAAPLHALPAVFADERNESHWRYLHLLELVAASGVHEERLLLFVPDWNQDTSAFPQLLVVGGRYGRGACSDQNRVVRSVLSPAQGSVAEKE